MSAEPVHDELLRRLRGLRRERAGQALLLCGPAGIGKTHLAARLLQHLSVRSVRVRADLPLSALLGALPAARRPPAWTEPVFGAVRGGASPPVSALLDALAAHLQACAPLLLHVEDVHEAGADRQAFWAGLAGAVRRGRGAALLFTSREPLPQTEVFSLQPMDRQQTGAMLNAEAGTSLPQEALDWMHSWGGGNPLFAREYFRLLSRRGHLWSDGRQWRWREPPPGTHPSTAVALVAARLAGVQDGAARRLLDALTLLPAHTRLQDAVRVAGVPDDDAVPAWEQLLRSGVMSPQGFAHPLYREVHLGNLPGGLKRDLARRALEVYAGLPEEAAALVVLAAPDRPHAARLLRSAAASAARRGDAATQARWLWEAAGCLQGVRRAALARRAALVCESIQQDLALESAREAERLHPHLKVAALASRCLARGGALDEARQLLERHRRPAADWWTAWIELHVLGGDDAGAQRAWAQVQEDGLLLGAAAHALMSSSLLNLGDTDGAERTAQQAQTLLTPHDPLPVRLRILNVRAGVAYFGGRFGEAQTFQDEAIVLSLAAGRLAEAAGGHGNRALARVARGETDAALADLEASMRLYAAAGQGRQHAFQQQRYGGVLARAGQWERAEEQLLEACDALGLCDALGWQAESHSELAKLYLEWRPPHGPVQALHHARSALESARRLGNANYLTDALFAAGWAEAQCGLAQVALQLASELSGLSSGEHSLAQGYACWVRGLALVAAGERPAALNALNDAAATFSARRIEVLRQRVLLEVAALNRDQLQLEAGVAYFESRGLYGRAAVGRRAMHSRPVAPTRTPRLELRLLGPPEVWHAAGRRPIGGRQSQQLLACLGEAVVLGASEVDQTTLCQTLYPGLDEAQGAASLQQVIHRLRLSLGRELIVRTAQGYALGDGVTVDAAQFMQTRETELWRGPYLNGETQSRSARQLYDALREAAPLAPAARQAFLAELLLQADPYRHDTLVFALETLRRARAYRPLTRTYARASRTFAEVGEILPTTWQGYLSNRQREPEPGS